MPAAPALRWGLTLPFPGVTLAECEPLVRQAEAAGYDDLWSGDTTGPDGFTPLALAAAWTDRPRLGTGIVSAFTRTPVVLAQHAAALADASGGRFVLGVGASSNVIVERWNEIPFERPLSKIRETVAALRPILAGDRGPGGFKLEQPPAAPVPIYIAALRQKMLELGGEIADGVFVNFLPLSGAESVCNTITAASNGSDRGGEVDVVCRFFCIPGSIEDGIALARFMFAAYGTVPVYAEFFRSLGWAEQLDPMVDAWRSGDRKRALELAPDELIKEIFIFGSPKEQHARLARYADAGITTFVLTPIAAPEQLPKLIDALAHR
ncbi:MAG: LLM class F420-dependent oxidoreductase [Solirubrobacteraceae bacterium]